MKEEKDIQSSRRKFLQIGIAAAGITALAGASVLKEVSGANEEEAGRKVMVLTEDGKKVVVPASHIQDIPAKSKGEIREGFPKRKFVMVVDLSRCRNALKCQDSCNKNHFISGQNAWIKIYKMQESEDTAPYWMPMMCQHCDEPACVTVCPVDATFKRRDGIVLIDNERCIGCRFCMAACPYSTRVFNWSEPAQQRLFSESDHAPEHSPEHAGHPSIKGTVDKCDFCPHMIDQGKLPHCVSACPNDVFLFGDKYEDTVTNGSGESFRLSHLLEDRAGFRFMDRLGTHPSVYYLPPVDRSDPFEEGLKNYTEFESVRKPE